MDKSSTATPCLHFRVYHQHLTCAGKENHVADALSWARIHLVQEGIDYEAMATSEKEDSEVQACRTALTSLQLEDVPYGNQGNTILCDTSTGQPRPVVLQDGEGGFSTFYFDYPIHPSIRTTRRLIASKFVWHGLNKQVGIWARACMPCQTSKVHWHIKAPFQTFHVPCRHFDHIHIYLVGPLPPSKGFTHLLTIVDRSTRWPEAVPL